MEPDELFDILDAHGQIVGTAPRSVCHGDPRLIHRAVHVIVLDGSGSIYLQKRARTKTIQPGMWDSSVGGHLSAGESYEEAAVRELAEELGIRGVAIRYLFDYEVRNEIESEDIRSYTVDYQGVIRPDPVEIEEGRFWSCSEIETFLGSGVLTPSFEIEFGLLKQHGLPEVEVGLRARSGPGYRDAGGDR